jgi:hypothetical protein
MLISTALGSQVQLEGSARAMVTIKGVPEIVPLVPAALGALLKFWGSIRTSLTARPLHLLPFGLILAVVATVLPFVAAQLFPEMKSYPWTLLSVVPLFVVPITGLIFLSTALLRLAVGTKDRG